MSWKPQSHLNPIEFDRRVTESHRNKVWTVSVMVLTEIAYLVVAGLTGRLTGIAASAGAVAVAIASFLFAGWVERGWRRFHTVPLQMLDEEVVSLNQELRTRDRVSAKQRKRQEIANILTEKHTDGVNRILNLGFMTANDSSSFDRACADADEWLADVIACMEEVGCTMQNVQRVQVLHKFDLLALRPETARINKYASMFSARLDRLQDIINKYAQN